MKIYFKQAEEVAKELIEVAKADGGDPVSVTIVGMDGIRIVSYKMDDAVPISAEISEAKARTAVLIDGETLRLEEKKHNPGNFINPSICCFAGGVPVGKVNKLIGTPKNTPFDTLGAVGVSGRRSYSSEGNSNEDHELALAASISLGELVMNGSKQSIKSILEDMKKLKKRNII